MLQVLLPGVDLQVISILLISRQACRNSGTTKITSVELPPCSARLPKGSAAEFHLLTSPFAHGRANRQDIGDSLPPLRGGSRVQTDDCLQGWSFRLPRLRPHRSPRRAGVQMQVPPLPEPDAAAQPLLRISPLKFLRVRSMCRAGGHYDCREECVP